MTAHRDKRDLIAAIKPLREQRMSFRRIGELIGLSHERVRQLWQLSLVEDETPSAQN